MEDEHRLPLNHPTRIAVREKKLWTRELSWAIREQHRTSQTHLKMSCPCKLCDKGYRQEKYVETVLHHLDAQKMFGRDPKHYGSSKGYDPDESDEEWDNHILHSYGSLATLPPSEHQSAPLEDDYDISECVVSSFNVYDNLCGEPFPNVRPREPDVDIRTENNVPVQPDQGESSNSPSDAERREEPIRSPTDPPMGQHIHRNSAGLDGGNSNAQGCDEPLP
ncbi:hypothetical protein M758_UG222800 [Ceratodon purpureus]|nr:hypothetical protein M758_UG222800 [Ceratodon purpureus]